ncbi:MAG: sulfatase-like hydrolase/transferase [Verrucomicrobiota bacterium]|jgi:arylsulfatase A-like enzyme
MKFKRPLIWLAIWLAFSCATRADLPSLFTNATPGAQPLPRRPSIILVVADGLGYGDLSCYGQTNFQTPSLDRLAAEGVRFTNYYAADTANLPGWAALLLGRDAEHLRQSADATVPLAPGEATVAQILQPAGYRTGFIGEWDLGDENSSGAPWKKGFNEFAGYLGPADAANFYADYIWSLPPHYSYDQASGKFIQWDPSRGLPSAGKEMIYVNTKGKNEYIPDLLAKASLNFIKDNQPDQFNHYRPFFLVLNYPLPGAGNGTVPTDAPYSDEPWPQAQKNKAAMISRLDGFISQLEEQLPKFGLTNDVVLFFTSAAGPRTNGGVDPNFFHSIAPSNPLRVPMIVRWTGTLPAGAVSAVPWGAADFLPTAAQIAVIPPPGGIDGASLLPSLAALGPTNRVSRLKP